MDPSLELGFDDWNHGTDNTRISLWKKKRPSSNNSDLEEEDSVFVQLEAGIFGKPKQKGSSTLKDASEERRKTEPPEPKDAS